MNITPTIQQRFNTLKEKYQCSDNDLMTLLLESFEVANGDRAVQSNENAISTTGQKRDSAYIPLGF